MIGWNTKAKIFQISLERAVVSARTTCCNLLRCDPFIFVLPVARYLVDVWTGLMVVLGAVTWLPDHWVFLDGLC